MFKVIKTAFDKSAVAKIGKALADPTNGDKWMEAGCGALNMVPVASELVGVACEIRKPIKCAGKGVRYPGFDPAHCLRGGDALERAIYDGRNKSRGIWIGKRGLFCRAVMVPTLGNLNVFHTAIILDGHGYSFDPNSNGTGQDLQEFYHSDREAGSYEWKKIAGYSVTKPAAEISRKAEQIARDYSLIRNNCQNFVQTMAQYASGSCHIDTGVAF